jgi:nitrogen regulatory protein P-II 2
MSLVTHTKRQLTIVAEAVIEARLIELARRAGVLGYSASEVRGGGAERDNEAAWDIDRMVEIKVVADEAVINAIAQQVLERFAKHYAVSLILSDVQVLRPQKY